MRGHGGVGGMQAGPLSPQPSLLVRGAVPRRWVAAAGGPQRRRSGGRGGEWGAVGVTPGAAARRGRAGPAPGGVPVAFQRNGS